MAAGERGWKQWRATWNAGATLCGKKWLQHLAVTNDFKANDTYANQNNDPESHLKTAAYIDHSAQPR